MSVYLDHAATTPMRPETFEAMRPWLTERFGNPSGAHAVARAARLAVDDARDAVAGCLGVDPGGVVFTGGGTEADNLALLGHLRAHPGSIVTTTAEHHAVLHAAAASGAEVRTVAVTADGVVDLEALAGVLDDRVSIVSVMLVNNEVGSVTPFADVVHLVRRHARRALIHTDAVQAVPWLDVAAAAAGADLISISGHKFGGPQGVGALVVRGPAELQPVIHGGGQERDRRSGTHNVAGIVGLAAALEVTTARRDQEIARVTELRDRLADGLIGAVPGTVETGRRAMKVAGNCHLRFAGVESESLLVLLDDAGICASAGSACTSGAMEPSHVLVAMGIPVDDALGSVRFSLGATTTDADVDLALKAVPGAVERLRPR
jgi:cysteine desulfurase